MSLFFSSIALHLGALIFLFPIGSIILNFSGLSKGNTSYCAAYAASLPFAAGVQTLLWLFEFSPGLQQTIWILLVVAACIGWLKWSLWRHVALKPFIWINIVSILLLFFTIRISVYSTGDISEISFRSTADITQLPEDLLIPYNFSRLILDGEALGSREVIPRWSAFDRGPLAGILNAAWFRFLGAAEHAPWNSVTPGCYFLYQGFISFLHLLAFQYFVMLLFTHYGARTAALGSITLCSSYFFILNAAASWPKLMLVVFILAAMEADKLKKPLLIGLLLGCAVLTHDSAALAAVGCLVLRPLWLWREGLRIKPLAVDLVYLALGIAIALAPWQYAKTSAGHQSKLLMEHVFCEKGPEADDISITEAAKEYLDANSPAAILVDRFHNLSYPFTLGGAGHVLLGSQSLNDLIKTLRATKFFTLLGTFGAFLPCLAAAVLLKKRKAFRPLDARWLAISFAALLVYSMVAGCSPTTSLHVWAYPALFFSALYIALCAGGGSRLALSLWSAGALFNALSMLAIFISRRTELTGAYSVEYSTSLMLIFVLILAAHFLPRHIQQRGVST